MSNEIINLSAEQAGQNADEQEVAQAPAAITKTPVDNTMEVKQNNDLEPAENAVTENEKSAQPVAEVKTNEESHETVNKVQDVIPASPHDDFDWSVDKRNVTSYNKKERER